MALGVMIPETAALKPVVWQRDMEYLRSRLPIVPETASLLAPSIDLTLPTSLKRSSRIPAKRNSTSTITTTTSSAPRSSSGPVSGSRDLASRASQRTTGTSSSSAPPSRLLDLPVEIRKQILSYLLPGRAHGAGGARAQHRLYTDGDAAALVGGNLYYREPWPATPASLSASLPPTHQPVLAHNYGHGPGLAPGGAGTTTRHRGATTAQQHHHHHHHHQHRRGKKRPRHPLAVMRLNQQLYAECLALVYSEPLFHFVGTAYLPVLDFFRRLGPKARGAVRKVRLTLLQLDGLPLAGVGAVARGGLLGPGVGCGVVGVGGGLGGGGGAGGCTWDWLERLCQEIHDQLPGLEVLKPDPWVWL
ncbi:MAG: hypothetical protein M1822_001239 [Bathelium mastoideum]|nr:MAG: hypothetical protein M1822_001239 [Bathelium mastoideum]